MRVAVPVDVTASRRPTILASAAVAVDVTERDLSRALIGVSVAVLVDVAASGRPTRLTSDKAPVEVTDMLRAAERTNAALEVLVTDWMRPTVRKKVAVAVDVAASVIGVVAGPAGADGGAIICVAGLTLRGVGEPAR